MNKNLLCLMATGLLAAGALTSCVSDEPFGDGNGELRMKMVMNSTLTRSGEDVTDQDLADQCVVYLSGSKGLLYKYQGVENLPSSLYLKSGSYVAEAWTGDSVSASFDKKFYRGYEPFDINTGETTNVVINCRIANVVASVSLSQDVAAIVKDYKVTVGHSKATLDFTPENVDAHAYFMMPNEDTNLTYTITGTLVNGESFTKEGTIWNVQRAHEYTLNIGYNATPATPFGGAFITVTIDDTELVIEDNVVINGAPVFSGVGYDIDSPLLCEPGKFERRSIYVQSLGSLRSFALHTDNPEAFGLPGTDVDFVGLPEATRQLWATAGVSTVNETQENGIYCNRLYLEQEMLNRLTEGVYTLTLTAADSNNKKRVKNLVLNVSDAGVILVESPWYDIYAYHATVYGTIAKESMTNPGFRYREAGASEWITATDVVRNGNNISAVLTGLKGGTRYEYQAIADGYTNTDSMFFTTETPYVLPNGGFEDWSTGSDKALIPSASGQVEFWDSGNHGSITLSKNVTTDATNLFNSGSKSAKLQSQYVGFTFAGKFAAGNIFTGSFKGTENTYYGILDFGRTYNGSRPVKLRGHVYYHPGTVDYSEQDEYHPGTVKGSKDQGIVYIALMNKSIEMHTKTPSTLFNPNADYVLAYGQFLMTEDYGSESAMKEFEITLEYRDAARLQKATHLLIVGSASRYGDYYSGSTQSVMYLDDLELVY